MVGAVLVVAELLEATTTSFSGFEAQGAVGLKWSLALPRDPVLESANDASS